MKIVQILVLLATISTAAHSARPPQAAAPKVHRELSTNSQRCCVGCCACLCACYVYSVFLATDQARMQVEIQTLQATSYGRMAIEHLKKEGAKEGYEKGLIAGHTSCPPSPMMNRHQEGAQDGSNFRTCVRPSTFSITKKNN